MSADPTLQAVLQSPLETASLLVDTFHTRSRILVDIMTKRVKRRFTQEFRHEVVKLVLDGGQSSSQVARTHDLAPSLVAGWVRQAKTDMGVGVAGQLTSAEKEELTKARKDLRELRRENDFLKKQRLGSPAKTYEVRCN